MSPVSSAMGMNLSGVISPFSGCCQVDDGLVAQFDLVFLERLAQVHFERASGLDFLGHFLMEEPVDPSAAGLRSIERKV